jgi:hypothetical protein
MAIPAIMAASHQGDLYVDACDDCECADLGGSAGKLCCHCSSATDASLLPSSRTCHLGPDWLQIEACNAGGSDSDGSEDCERARAASFDEDEGLSIFNNELIIPLFKVPSQAMGEDVCAEMEHLVFGVSPPSVLQAPWFSNARDGNDSILQYWRWVKFAVEVEGDFSGNDELAGDRAWKNGPWVCCILAAQDSPFEEGKKYED